MKTKKILVMVTSLILCVSVAGFADDAVDFGDSTPTEEAIIKALDIPAAPKGYGTRALRPTKPAAPAPATKRAISMEITFEKNSFQLSPKSMENLDILGKALKSERLTTFTFIIEGHTDASGTDDYNMNLSEKRAESVKNYLMTKHDIDVSRLKTIGKGETEPVVKDNPYASKNRRVKIINNES